MLVQHSGLELSHSFLPVDVGFRPGTVFRVVTRCEVPLDYSELRHLLELHGRTRRLSQVDRL